MGVKVGDLPLPSGAPTWFAAHFWGHVPLILVSFYLVVAIYRQFRPSISPPTPKIEAKEQALPTQLPVVSSTPKPEPMHTPQLQPPDQTGRVFLSSKMTAMELLALRKGKTQVHADNAVQPYLGKWLRHRGPLEDVWVSDSAVHLCFELEGIRNLQADVSGCPELADVLHKGDEVEVVGKIKQIRQLDVILSDAEVIAR